MSVIGPTTDVLGSGRKWFARCVTVPGARNQLATGAAGAQVGRGAMPRRGRSPPPLGVSDLERGLRQAPYPATIRRLIEALGLGDTERVELLAASRRATSARGAD